MDSQDSIKQPQPSTSRQSPQEQLEVAEPSTSRTTTDTVSTIDGDCYWSDSVASNCDLTLSSPTNSNEIAQQHQQNHKAGSRESRQKCNTTNRNVRKRTQANERERERTRALNQALEILRNRLPVKESEKRSKIQTLRTAKEYIEFLARLKRLSHQQQEHCDQQQHQQQNHHHHQQQQHHHQYLQQQQLEQHQHQQQHQQHQQAYSSQQYGKLMASESGSQPTGSSNQLDSPLTYKFYKFRLKSQTKTD